MASELLRDRGVYPYRPARKGTAKPLINPWENCMSNKIVIASPATLELDQDSEPLPAHWVLGGMPEVRSKNLSRSRDWVSNVVVWECTSGRFEWHYDKDEVIMVVAGEAFMKHADGSERRFGPGDVGFFPSGTSCTWRVPVGIRKVAVLRETMSIPLGFGLKIWNKLLRVLGLNRKPVLLPDRETVPADRVQF